MKPGAWWIIASTFVSVALAIETRMASNSSVASTAVQTHGRREMRGMGDTMGDDHDHDHDMNTQMMADQKEGRKAENWGGQYYDLLINEGSYKFWAVFQLVTAALLIYSAFAAIYYAKFNLITADYDYGDYFYGRSMEPTPTLTSPWLGLNSQTFQNILNAVSSK